MRIDAGGVSICRGRSACPRMIRLFARALAGGDGVSFNLDRLRSGEDSLRPCEMPASSLSFSGMDSPHSSSSEFSPTSRYRLCCDAYRLRLKLFAVNFPLDVGSDDSHGVPVRPAPWLAFCLLIVSAGMQERGRGDYKSHRSWSPLRKRRLVLRLPRGTSRYLRPPTIPNDYSSTITIPKLNFRSPERTVTMQETYADRCREGHLLGGELEWTTKFRRGARSVRRSNPPR